MTDLIVTKLTFEETPVLAAALYEDRKLEELAVERDGQSSLVSKVYAGVVDSVSRNIGGAFVDIGQKELCFLPLKKNAHVQGSQKLLVQVTKDAAGRKEAVLTENIHLSGRNAVVMRRGGGVAFSKKLTDGQRETLSGWFPKDKTCAHGILLRTNAARAEKDEVLSEIAELTERMDGILLDGERAKKGQCLYSPPPFYLAFARDLREKPDRMFSDIPAVAAELAVIAGRADGISEEAEGAVYRAPQGKALSLPALYNLSHELQRLQNRQVFLRSGAFLVIEQTEAFCAVDVNSGRCTGGRKPEETYRRINLEAAEEIARQLRLRNLSGMILVDFISMRDPAHGEELVHVMRKLVKRDRVLTEVVDLTPLGIMEIVRQKIRKPLAEALRLC